MMTMIMTPMMMMMVKLLSIVCGNNCRRRSHSRNSSQCYRVPWELKMNQPLNNLYVVLNLPLGGLSHQEHVETWLRSQFRIPCWMLEVTCSVGSFRGGSPQPLNTNHTQKPWNALLPLWSTTIPPPIVCLTLGPHSHLIIPLPHQGIIYLVCCSQW